MIELNMIKLSTTKGMPLWVRVDRIESIRGAQQTVIRTTSGDTHQVKESAEQVRKLLVDLMTELSSRGMLRR